VRVPSLAAVAAGPARDHGETEEGPPPWTGDGEPQPAAATPGQEILEGLERWVEAQGFEKPVLLTLLAGLGCFALLAFTTFTAWINVNVRALSQSTLGIGTGEGRVVLLLALGGAAFVVVSLIQQRRLVASTLTAGALGTFIFFVLISTWRNAPKVASVMIGSWGDDALARTLIGVKGVSPGFGLFVAMMAALGVAGTFIYFAVLRPTKSAMLEPLLENYPVIQTHAVLIGVQVLAFVMGVVFILAR
jgi:hypothetical protein